ncbi:transmembrane protein, putative (macronuclear) [Tetrahymena thermophila SB210]|uniref:Transmembrane protein, putative n=1 Tax=Tetrahymena thermophila (strain SB210) TaxID=312017 RepID=W7XJZ7_TETTS|nr:transmembrane protein, putative [Tetrahymena thermophila SB210]EWS74464.1 transmembrane protein, putative [Tetrahymena thermophila SB210]|eukprot:XP_012653041.1 transmembrane protein, putative [Tetrahymena thermophila SB210]
MFRIKEINQSQKSQKKGETFKIQICTHIKLQNIYRMALIQGYLIEWIDQKKSLHQNQKQKDHLLLRNDLHKKLQFQINFGTQKFLDFKKQSILNKKDRISFYLYIYLFTYLARCLIILKLLKLWFDLFISYKKNVFIYLFCSNLKINWNKINSCSNYFRARINFVVNILIKNIEQNIILKYYITYFKLQIKISSIIKRLISEKTKDKRENFILIIVYIFLNELIFIFKLKYELFNLCQICLIKIFQAFCQNLKTVVFKVCNFKNLQNLYLFFG